MNWRTLSGALPVTTIALGAAGTAEANHESEAPAPGTAATTSGSSGYSSDSMNENIDKSCQDADVGSNGTISIYCNYKDPDGETDHKENEVDIDNYAGCVEGVPSWNGTHLGSNATALDITTGSNGANYLVTAKCSTGTSAGTLKLGEKFKNSSGSMAAR